jgi:hypothetical protein
MKVISSALQSDLFAVSNKVTNLTQIQIMAKATGKDFEAFFVYGLVHAKQCSTMSTMSSERILSTLL